MNLSNRFRLWSFEEMRRFFAAAFSTAFVELEKLQGDSIMMADDEAGWKEKATKCLQDMSEECLEAGFDRLQDRCNRFANQIQSLPTLTACYMLRDLLPEIQREMCRNMYFLVPESHKSLYHEDDRPLFGEAVARAIPNTTSEIAEAGRCLALDRWTACVFHLMRAVELALHKWCADLNVPLAVPAEQANWQDILNKADKRLKEIEQQPKTPQRDADLEYFGSASAHFRSIKDAWRNHVSHSKKTYDERETTTILSHVRAFLTTLATRPTP
jgi:hypothetical protein